MICACHSLAGDVQQAAKQNQGHSTELLVHLLLEHQRVTALSLSCAKLRSAMSSSLMLQASLL